MMDDDDDDDDALNTKTLSSFTAKMVYNLYAASLHFICHYFYGKYFNYNNLVSEIFFFLGWIFGPFFPVCRICLYLLINSLKDDSNIRVN